MVLKVEHGTVDRGHRLHLEATMKFRSLIAMCAVLSTAIACASTAPEDATQAGERDAVRAPRGTSNEAEASPGEVSILRATECSSSEGSAAFLHCYTNHPGNYVTSCSYNAASGYIVYTYAPCPLLPVGPPGCGLLH